MSGSQRKGGRTTVLEGRVRQARQATVDAPLERKASGELLDELTLMELEILRRYKAHLAAQANEAAPETPARARIVRKLRRLQ